MSVISCDFIIAPKFEESTIKKLTTLDAFNDDKGVGIQTEASYLYPRQGQKNRAGELQGADIGAGAGHTGRTAPRDSWLHF